MTDGDTHGGAAPNAPVKRFMDRLNEQTPSMVRVDHCFNPNESVRLVWKSFGKATRETDRVLDNPGDAARYLCEHAVESAIRSVAGEVRNDRIIPILEHILSDLRDPNPDESTDD